MESNTAIRILLSNRNRGVEIEEVKRTARPKVLQTALVRRGPAHGVERHPGQRDYLGLPILLVLLLKWNRDFERGKDRQNSDRMESVLTESARRRS